MALTQQPFDKESWSPGQVADELEEPDESGLSAGAQKIVAANRQARLRKEKNAADSSASGRGKLGGLVHAWCDRVGQEGMLNDKSAELSASTCTQSGLYTASLSLCHSVSVSVLSLCLCVTPMSTEPGSERTLDVLRLLDHGQTPSNLQLLLQLVRYLASQPQRDTGTQGHRDTGASRGSGAILVFLPGTDSTE